jgi:two-component system, OmpR family, response regulator
VDANAINKTQSILIVDDEPDICFMLSSILRKKELNSTSVHCIKDAGSYLQIKTPSLVFLDNNLPDGRGIDFLSGIKRNHPDVKVIMITAYDTYSDKTDALQQGADEFLGKPFTRQSIYDAVDKLMPVRTH